MSSCNDVKAFISLLLKDNIRHSILSFLTLRGICHLFNVLEPELEEIDLIEFVKYARSISHDDILDSFFEVEEFDCFLFLRWCNKNEISLKRLFLHISDDLKYSNSNLIPWALVTYLETWGSELRAISLKFSRNSNMAESIITSVFTLCQNIFMFALEGRRLKMDPYQCERILQTARGCPFLRDWVLVGRTPLIKDNNIEDMQRFCNTIKAALGGNDEVHELFLSRKQRSLQACQYTMTALESLLEKKGLRLTRIRRKKGLYKGIDHMLDQMLHTFDDGVVALSIDWITGSRWGSHCLMGQIKRLSIWGLTHDDLDNRAEYQESFHQFFEQHTSLDNWVTPVHLGLHMIDNTHHMALFKFISRLLHKDNVYLRSLNISVESDNDGVMSIHPTTYYCPPIKFGVMNQLIRKTQILYNLNAAAAEIRLHKYGRRHKRQMYDDFPEFEEIFRVYHILHYNHDLAIEYGYGILLWLTVFKQEVENRDCFTRLYARGFERDFMNDDVMRLETVPFAVEF